MVDFNSQFQEGNRIYEDDIKIRVPKEVKHYIITEMLHIMEDLEDTNKLSKFDSIIEYNGKRIEWKNGKRKFDGRKLPIEIYLDHQSNFPGCFSEAKGDYLIFVKEYEDNPLFYDIFCFDYKKFVSWWWDSGLAKHLAKFAFKNQVTIKNDGTSWQSSFYPFIINKIPRDILIDQKIFFDARPLFKTKDMSLKKFF